ncbi:MAG TPA: thiolase family protein [Phycisphaerae bacterium]|nr:thiolase family protein [Phycisphaerae bacterium]HNU46028.1 thiolase family protein [Phycisphaerae bacterium]
MKNIYVTHGVRTPFGSLNGALAEMTAAQLGSVVIREALQRAGIKGEDVHEVIVGNVIQAGSGQNVARQASIGAGIPRSVGCTTVNKVCGSSMRAIIDAARIIQCGDAGVIVAAGCESMTNAPYILRKARSGYRMGNGELIDVMIHDGLWDAHTNQHMGNCGELCSAKYNITREEQDVYSNQSYQGAIKAWEDGSFKQEVVPVEIKTRKGSVIVDKDEDLAKYKGMEGLRGLKPAFKKDGVVTAGNASNIDDGAAAVIVFDDEHKQKLGLKPAARILGYDSFATDPEWFTIAPLHAIKKLCDKLRIKPTDVDLYEINEAFAVVPMVAIKELGLDRGRVNIFGGAVAIGHPIGASGARIVVTLLNALKQRNKKLGMASACLGGGEATVIAVERC